MFGGYPKIIGVCRCTFLFSRGSILQNLQLNFKQKMPFYAVARGQIPGIYSTWDECKTQVTGYPNACYKKFNTKEEAKNFVEENGSSSSVSVCTGVASSSSQTKLESRVSKSKATGNASAVSLDFQKTFSRKRARPGYDPKDFVTDEEGFVHVYTDGACESNGRIGARAGVGVWFNDNHPMNVSEPVNGRPTNNTAEIQAAINAIEVASACGIEKLLIHTDSQFLINAATQWISGWKRKGWKLASGEPVKNEEDFKVLDLALRSVEVSWNYVPGHKGIHGNEMADELARQGATRYV